jgi:hypothetical protein
VRLVRDSGGPHSRPWPAQNNPDEDILLDLVAPEPPAFADESGAVLIDPALLAGATESRRSGRHPADHARASPQYGGQHARDRAARTAGRHPPVRNGPALGDPAGRDKPTYALGVGGRSGDALMLRPSPHTGHPVSPS